MKRLVVALASASLVASAQAFTVRPTSPLSSKTTTSLSFSLTPLEEVLSDSDLIQDEFCNGMTHALLDCAGFWGGAAATRVRLAAVLGRLFVIGQDVQHEVLPDELAFQLGLLAVACHGLMSSVVPKLKAKFMMPTFMASRDRQAYRALFRPAGLSWVDFKQLHSESIMDWVQVEPGHVLWNDKDPEDAVYWLYEGSVQVFGNETLSHHISGRQEVAGLGLFGEGRLAKLLDSRQKDPTSAPQKPTGWKATAESGATLLRINTTKLEKLLRHDQEMTHAIHRLAFMGMQDKLDALLLKEAPAP